MPFIWYSLLLALGGVLFYWGKEKFGSWWVVFVGVILMASGLTGCGIETSEVVRADKCREVAYQTKRETRYVKYDKCYIKLGRKFVPLETWSVNTRGMGV